MASIQCVVVTPEETALEQESSFVVVPLFDGELGIAPGHSPLIGRLGYGELRLKSADGSVERYYVDGGFAQVADNAVTVLTGRLTPAADLDTSNIEAQLQESLQKPGNTDELADIREKSISQARAQLAVARRS